MGIGLRCAGAFLLCCAFDGANVAVADQFAAVDHASAQDERDPWQGFNRAIFTFNDTLDRYLLKPVAKGYRWVTPQIVEDGIGNMFSNVGEVGTVVNDLLQFKFAQAGADTGRFLINSTVGLVGFFDAAASLGLEEHDEDFGQTLGYWGVNAGPYVVIPLIGPRTVRDTAGWGVDLYTDPLAYVDYVPTRNTVAGTRFTANRAALLKAEELITGDRYIFIRDAYLQQRDFLVNDGVVEDSFGEDDGELEHWDEEF